MWMCKTCAVGTSHCYCASCFLPPLHQGHSCQFYLGMRGTCDCGDTQLLKATSFCPAHRREETLAQSSHLDLLPLYIRRVLPSLLKDFVDDVHRCLCSWPLSNTDYDTPDAIERVVSALGIILQLLLSNGVLLSLGCDYLLTSIPGHTTKHRCLKTPVDQPLAEHECTCSIVDCIVHNLPTLGNYKELILAFNELAKKCRRFGEAFYIAYIVFYEDIIMAAEYRSAPDCMVDNIPCQASDVKEFVRAALRQHLPSFTKVVEKVVRLYVAEGGKDARLLGLVYSDFMGLVMHTQDQTRFLLEETDFEERFLAACSWLQATDYRNHGPQEDFGGEFFLTLMFSCQFISYRFVYPLQPPVIRVFRLFRRLIEADHVANKSVYLSPAEVPGPDNDHLFLNSMLYRLFALLLNKLIVELADTEAGHNIEELRQYVQGLLGFQSDIELDTFLKLTLVPTLRVLTSACKYVVGLQQQLTQTQQTTIDMYYNSTGRLSQIDILAVQLSLALLSPKAGGYAAVLEEGLGLNLALKVKESSEADCKYVEALLFLLGSIMFNDYNRLLLYVAMSTLFPNRSVTAETQALHSAGLRRNLMVILLEQQYESEVFKSLQLPSLMARIAGEFKSDTLEDDLAGVLAVNAGKTGYTITHETMQMANMFNHTCVGNLHSFEQNYIRVLAYLKLPHRNVCDFQPLPLPGLQLLGSAVLARLCDSTLSRVICSILSSNDPMSDGEMTKACCLYILSAIHQSPGAASNPGFLEPEFVVPVALALDHLKTLKPLYQATVDAFLSPLVTRYGNVQFTHVIAATKDSKKKQAEVLEEFSKKRELAYDRLKQDMPSATPTSAQDAALPTSTARALSLCGYCRESISLGSPAERPSGEICYIVRVGVLAQALQRELQSLRHLWRGNNVTSDHILEPELITVVVRHGLAFNACGHYLHLDCERKYRMEREEQLKSGIYSCPICKSKSNSIIPHVDSPAELGLDILTMQAIARLFDLILRLIEGEEGEGQQRDVPLYLEYEKMQRVFKVLWLTTLYSVQSVRISGLQSLLCKHGRIIPRLFALFFRCLSDYSRNQLQPPACLATLGKASGLFSIDYLGLFVSRLCQKLHGPESRTDVLKPDDILHMLHGVFMQSTLRQALVMMAANPTEVLTAKGMYQQLLKGRAKFMLGAQADCAFFLEKCVAAVAMLEGWSTERCEKAAEARDPLRQIEGLCTVLQVGKDITEELLRLANCTFDSEKELCEELEKYQLECEQLCAKRRSQEEGATTEGPEKLCGLALHSRLACKTRG